MRTNNRNIVKLAVLGILDEVYGRKILQRLLKTPAPHREHPKSGARTSLKSNRLGG